MINIDIFGLNWSLNFQVRTVNENTHVFVFDIWSDYYVYMTAS